MCMVYVYGVFACLYYGECVCMGHVNAHIFQYLIHVYMYTHWCMYMLLWMYLLLHMRFDCYCAVDGRTDVVHIRNTTVYLCMYMV